MQANLLIKIPSSSLGNTVKEHSDGMSENFSKDLGFDIYFLEHSTSLL